MQGVQNVCMYACITDRITLTLTKIKWLPKLAYGSTARDLQHCPEKKFLKICVKTVNNQQKLVFLFPITSAYMCLLWAQRLQMVTRLVLQELTTRHLMKPPGLKSNIPNNAMIFFLWTRKCTFSTHDCRHITSNI